MFSLVGDIGRGDCPYRDHYNPPRSGCSGMFRSTGMTLDLVDIRRQHLRPFSEKVRNLPAGWLIPIAILIIISFPPLFGHEVVALLCGVVYGLWIGFGIVAAGTFLGESVFPLHPLSQILTKQSVHGSPSNISSAQKPKSSSRRTSTTGLWLV